jgi:hypothetical protein
VRYPGRGGVFLQPFAAPAARLAEDADDTEADPVLR